MAKYTKEEILKVSPVYLLKFLDFAKQKLKQDETIKNIFKERNLDIDAFDLLPIVFTDKIDVSARTDHGIVYLNYKLLEDGDFAKCFQYIVHETTHWADQVFGKKATKSSDNEGYLDNKFEQDAFSNQVKFIADHNGEKEAEKYIDHLLDYHEIDNKNEKEEKKDILFSKVDE